MKCGILVLALAFAPACAIASGDAPAVIAGACAVPQIPAVSTSPAGARRVKKAIKKWDACVAVNPGTDSAIVAAVAKQAGDWSKATLEYSGGQQNSAIAAQHHMNAKREFEQDNRNAAAARMQGRTQ